MMRSEIHLVDNQLCITSKTRYQSVLSHTLWTVIAIGLFLMLFLRSSGNCITAFGAAGSVTGDGVKQKLTFENAYVEAGIPLKVEGAKGEFKYHWVITDAAGEARSFTTDDNTYTPDNHDLEKLISVTYGLETASIYYSRLPVVYITSQTGYYHVGDEYSDATMSIQGNIELTNNSQCYDGKIKIKLRGNSTRMRDKRPFHIKLEKKTNLLGLGKNKHFALLANDIDHTLMRNKLLYDFSGDIGMDTYEKSENVVVIYNNAYYGVYLLSELVNVGPDRVDIYDWEESAETAAKEIVKNQVEQGRLTSEAADRAATDLRAAMRKDLRWISNPYTFTYDVNGDGTEETYKITDYISIPKATGGALLEMDFFAFDGHNPSTLVSAYSQPLYFKAPEYAITNQDLYNNISHYIQSFEYVLHSTDFIYHENSIKYHAKNRSGGSSNLGYAKSGFRAPEYDGKHYSELFDLDSLIQNFLVCEYSMNWDSMKNSVFLYKDINGLFHMGPEWDFDWAWGNINMYGTNTWYPTSWQTTENAFTREQYYQSVQWNRLLIRDPYFLVRAYEKYKEIRGPVIEAMIKDGGTIDANIHKLRDAAAANDAKWSYTYAAYHSVGFEESVNNMKTFLAARIKWLDDQFSSLDTFISSLGVYKPDEALSISAINTQTDKNDTEITSKVINPDIASIVFQVNGIHTYAAPVKEGQAICQVPDSALVTDPKVLNVVQILAVDSDGNYMTNSKEEGNYAVAKSNYAVFYTSAQTMSTAVKMQMNHRQAIIGIVVLIACGGMLGVILFILIRKRRLK